MSDAATKAWGHGLVTLDEGGAVLDAWFPAPALGTADGSEAPAELDDAGRAGRRTPRHP